MSLETRKFKKNMLVAVAAIIEHIDQHPLDQKTTLQYAREAGINRKRLQATFRHLTGIGVQEYRLGRRMSIAGQLLQAGEKSIKEIAIICHFKSQRAFSTAFKKAFSMTPLQYQNHNF